MEVSDFRPSRCLKFLQVFLALERICANATSPNNRSRSLKPVKLGVARLDTWLDIAPKPLGWVMQLPTMDRVEHGI